MPIRSSSSKSFPDRFPLRNFGQNMYLLLAAPRQRLETYLVYKTSIANITKDLPFCYHSHVKISA